jgi:cobalt-zinc-cadmium efflux system membrane fusion protein
MLTLIHQEKQFSKLLLLSTFGFFSLVPNSDAQTNTQIHISQQQITRSGIRIEAAVPATNGGLAANANLADKGLRLSGTVVAATSATQLLSAVVSGVIQTIHVNPLQEVKAGTPIATILANN